MSLYTFFTTRADGSPLLFEAFEQGDDAAALACAAKLLRFHTDETTDIIAWLGDRKVFTLNRLRGAFYHSAKESLCVAA